MKLGKKKKIGQEEAAAVSNGEETTDLTKLSKKDLLEIMLKQGEEIDALRAEVQKLKDKLDEQNKKKVLWILAIIGAVVAIVAIAFAVYRFFAPDYLEDFEEDFDEDFDDYFEDEEEPKKEEAEEAEEEKTEE